MKGLELARGYYEATFHTLFQGELFCVKSFCAAGLSGEGSECFGFDDEISRDHDFSPEYCIWIPNSKYKDFSRLLERAYDLLPGSFENVNRKSGTVIRNRRGIQTIEGFFQKYTGLTHIPVTNAQWLNIPESFLAVATNGEVFVDYLGEFSRWRNVLKMFYPQDVFLKKLSARLAVMGQAGQYNYKRCSLRKDFSAAYLAGHEFTVNALSAIYLLNKRYMPFYKWSFHGAKELSLLRNAVAKLEEFAALSDISISQKWALIESISADIIEELIRQGLSVYRDDFLMTYGFGLLDAISDNELKRMNIFADTR